MKKNIMFVVFSSITALLLLIGGGVADAEIINVSGKLLQNNETDLDFVKTEVEVENEVELGAKGSSGKSDSLNAGIKSELEVNSSARIGTTSDDKETGNLVSIKARELRGWDEEKKEEFMLTVKSWAEVKSGQDLENFARGIILRDENVQEVETETKGIKVTYKFPAKFLGIFNSTLSTEVEVDLETRVKVNFPWYRFLYRVSSEVSEANLETSVETELENDSSVAIQTETQENLQAQARLFQTISNVLKIKHDTVIKN
ncbi:MAG TPA: hypothetical protein VJC04_03645 [Candidatus Paceibacterota bacterium]